MDQQLNRLRMRSAVTLHLLAFSFVSDFTTSDRLINRPGVAGAVLQTLTNTVLQTLFQCFSIKKNLGLLGWESYDSYGVIAGKASVFFFSPVIVPPFINIYYYRFSQYPY